MADVRYIDEFPFFHQSLSNSSNPGWIDVADTYPAVVGAPDADQVENRLQGTTQAGLFMFGLSATYQINATNNSVQARFSIDGGGFWENFSKETKDTTDRDTIDYLFPLDHLGGAFDFVIQIKKENSGNILNVQFVNVWFDRKK